MQTEPSNMMTVTEMISSGWAAQMALNHPMDMGGLHTTPPQIALQIFNWLFIAAYKFIAWPCVSLRPPLTENCFYVGETQTFVSPTAAAVD